ncbi:MAG: DUF222 domain-containing protein, partial [Pseudonocardiaceae bacterium]
MEDVSDRVPAGTGWWRRGTAELVAALREREEQVRRLQAEQGQILAEMHSRGVMSTFGYPDVEALQTDVLRISRRDARLRAARARACHDRPGVGGAVVAAPAPATGEAFAAGTLGAEHVDALISILAQIPGQVPAGERAGYEHTLVQLAGQACPFVVRKAGRHLLERLSQDGQEPNDKEQVIPERELLWRWGRDGKFTFTGRLDTECGQLAESLLSPLAKPRPATDGQPDTRTVGQRHGDAFAELLEFTQRAAHLPTENGEPPTVIVTMTLEQLLRDILNTTPNTGTHTDTDVDCDASHDTDDTADEGDTGSRDTASGDT